MIDMTAYKIDAVGPPWRYVLRKDGEPVYVSSETAITRGDAVRQGVIDRTTSNHISKDPLFRPSGIIEIGGGHAATILANRAARFSFIGRCFPSMLHRSGIAIAPRLPMPPTSAPERICPAIAETIAMAER